MRNRTSSLLLAMLVLCLCSALANAQLPEEQGLRVNGVVIKFSLFAKGHATNEGVTRIFNIVDNTIERSLVNESTGVYVGYALQIERLENSTKLRISVKPLPEKAIRQLRDSIWSKRFAEKWPNKRGDDPTPLPRYPEPMTIDMSDVVELTLWINPENGAQIGDRLRFELDQPIPLRDFTLDEVALKLTDYRLLINGEVRSGDKPLLGGFVAPLPWFSVPGRGRFIFSIQPHEGYDFQKIGIIDENRISFTHGGDKYEWLSSLPIINQRGKWNLWVLHDPNFEPSKQALDDTNLISKGNCCLYGAFSRVYQLSRARE
jgi:hypothetical protein